MGLLDFKSSGGRGKASSVGSIPMRLRHLVRGPESWMSDSAVIDTPDGCRVRVHVTPRAKRNEIGGLHNDRLRLKLTAPPVEGKANAACVAFLAKRLHVARSRVRLVAGEKSRDKDLLVEGVTAKEAAQRLA